MKKRKLCPVCRKEKEASLVDTCMEAYKFVIDKIKNDHPEWVEKDGACPKCIEYYEKI